MRGRNEDAIAVVPAAQLLAVADGVGGAPRGGEASWRAIDAGARFAALVRSSRELRARTSDEAQAAMRELFHCAHEHVLRPGVGMATTLVAAWSWGRELVLGAVGDSRVYRQRAGQIEHLLGHARAGNEVWLGVEGHLAPDIRAETLHPGDRYLLCTDGVFGVIGASRLRSLLRAATAAECCHALLAAALAAGAPDNASAVVLDVMPPGPRPAARRPATRRVLREPRKGKAAGLVAKISLTGIGELTLDRLRQWGDISQCMWRSALYDALAPSKRPCVYITAEEAVSAAAAPTASRYLAVDSDVARRVRQVARRRGTTPGAWMASCLDQGATVRAPSAAE
jgi:protein phosphatase